MLNQFNIASVYLKGKNKQWKRTYNQQIRISYSYRGGVKVAHQMGLYGECFASIKEGKKMVEVRLNDEKRRKIKVGDIIKFIKIPEQNEGLEVEVTELRRYPTFKELYEDIPFQDFACDGWTIEEMIEGTYEIYIHLNRRKDGVH